jgi:hypothetical protein
MNDFTASGVPLSHGFSGALRLFAFWVANGTVGLPLLEGVDDYRPEMLASPSLMEQAFAIFANVVRLDEDGNPINARQAQERAAMWIRQYMTGQPADPPLEDWEVSLY